MAKKKRRRISGLPAIIILIVLLVGVIGAGAYFYYNGNRMMLPGEWTREVDITAEARAAAREYLSQAAFGDEINIEDYIPETSIESVLIVLDDGNISEQISRDSYELALSSCNEGLKVAVSDLIKHRIEENYIDTDMSVDELMQETFHMSIDDYLKQFGPRLIPEYNDLNDAYGMSAFYEADRNRLTLQYTDGNIAETGYAVTGGMLVIDYSSGAVVYYER